MRMAHIFVKNVEEENVKANYKDGVLTIVLPKLKEEKSSKTTINIE